MKKYLVIGNPIEHSLSPKLHNYWLKENNIDAVYDKKKLDENELKNIIFEVKEEKINGINVTVPFKKAVIPFLDELSPEAKNTQSVNTIYLQNGITIGHNTDIAGFELAIKYAKYEILGKKIFILGAGGVAPSIIYSLKKMKASKITISNRTKEKAEKLKNLFEPIDEKSIFISSSLFNPMLVALIIISNSVVSPQSIISRSSNNFFKFSAFSLVLLLNVIFEAFIFLSE